MVGVGLGILRSRSGPAWLLSRIRARTPGRKALSDQFFGSSLAVVASGHEQPVLLFQQLARDNSSGIDRADKARGWHRSRQRYRRQNARRSTPQSRACPTSTWISFASSGETNWAGSLPPIFRDGCRCACSPIGSRPRHWEGPCDLHNTQVAKIVAGTNFTLCGGSFPKAR